MLQEPSSTRITRGVTRLALALPSTHRSGLRMRVAPAPPLPLLLPLPAAPTSNLSRSWSRRSPGPETLAEQPAITRQAPTGSAIFSHVTDIKANSVPSLLRRCPCLGTIHAQNVGFPG